MNYETALAIWHRAKKEEIGVILELDPKDKRQIENVLYEARKKSGDQSLDAFMIARPGDAPNELWIVRKATDMSDFT